MLYKAILFLPLSTLLTACVVGTGTAEFTGLALFHDRRSGSTLFSDEGIEIEADFKRHSDKDLRTFTHINVTSYNRRVLLTGEAKTVEIKAKAVYLVRKISGVKIVHDEIVVGPLASFNSRSEDSYITTKVKTAIAETDNIPGYDATRVKVVTENNAVFLMGLLHRNEGPPSIAKAQSVKGVTKVVPFFEYLD